MARREYTSSRKLCGKTKPYCPRHAIDYRVLRDGRVAVFDAAQSLFSGPVPASSEQSGSTARDHAAHSSISLSPFQRITAFDEMGMQTAKELAKSVEASKGTRGGFPPIVCSGSSMLCRTDVAAKVVSGLHSSVLGVLSKTIAPAKV
jgi:hypothetical protein